MKEAFSRVCACGCLVLLAAVMPSAAQTQKWSAEFGGGVANPTGDAGSHVYTGWNFTAGGGYNFRPSVGVMGEFMYTSFGINRTTLDRLNFPDGDMHVWAFTANPILRLNPSGPVGAYVIGGGGVYHRLVEFTQPTVALIEGFDPFFGFFYPVLVPAEQVLRSYSTTKGGLNIGGGMTFALGSTNAKFYVEGRYHHMFTKVGTDIVPVTFGIRW